MIDLFLIPRGRTGGTLVATMLNAHSKLSMGYEVFPDRLLDETGAPYEPSFLLTLLDNPETVLDTNQFASSIKNNFGVFIMRAYRSGIQPSWIKAALQELLDTGRGLQTLDDRLDFIDTLLLRQRDASGKPRIGSKMRVDPRVLHRRNPKAVFIMLLRDGRDVLASRLNVGKFNTNPADCARDWISSLSDFEDFQQQSSATSHLIHYEKLVEDPRSELGTVLASLGLDWEDSVTSYLAAPQKLFDHSFGHLSVQKIGRGLNSESIGRWKTDLNPAQLDEFLSIAGDALRRFHYL